MNNFNPLLNEIFVFRPLDDIERMQDRLREISAYGPKDRTLRYAEGKWIPDDGEYDLAFIQGNTAYYINLPYYYNLIWSWHRDPIRFSNDWHYMTTDGSPHGRYTHWGLRAKHPNEIASRSAMDKACSLHGCANGSGAEIDAMNKWIENGLLKTRSGIIIRPPENPQCYLCARDNYGHDIYTLNRNREKYIALLKECDENWEKLTKQLQENRDDSIQCSQELADCERAIDEREARNKEYQEN